MSESDSPLLAWLGQQVTVIVDRPLGSHHPRHPDLVYPVNYGYLPRTMAPDGDPIDAYIIGVATPVSSMTGDVVAVVVRLDDVEDKLVVAPTDRRCSLTQIRHDLRFQEQYFDSEIVVAPSRIA
ncbi:MAG: inorganic diphosphatase [Chloroflexota bacterium]|nr:inorganic diphosphatase [Chloroflexota bacterium]